MMLSLEEKIGQMLMVGFHGLEPPQYILDWLKAGRIGGVIFFGRNIASPQQVADLTRACHEAAPHPILIAIDQEGGIVTRLRDGFSESPGAMALGVADSEKLAEDVSTVLAQELRALGINWNLAPVVDIAHDIANPSVGVRSLGSDKERVSQLAIAQVRGFQNAGVAATAKHFPGIGSTTLDTHETLPIIDGPVDFLWETDLVPFRAVVDSGVATVMISHVMFKAIDSRYPSTLSPQVIQGLLRKNIGFDGMICTDCMEMRAIADNYTPSESAILGALAGQDLLFFSHSFSPTESIHAAAYDDLLSAVQSGRVPMERIDDAVNRITAIKARFAITETPTTATVGTVANRKVMYDAARAGVVKVRDEKGLLPLQPSQGKRIAAVEFASITESGIVEQGGLTGLCANLQQQVPSIETVALLSTAPTEQQLATAHRLARESDILILVTRNAHLVEQQESLARELVDEARLVILFCLRNPYDVSLFPNVSTVICTCGDSTPSLHAAVDALLGKFTPTGVLPVPVEATL